MYTYMWGQDCNIFNKKAYINISDFENLDECVDYIFNLDDNKIKEMLNEYKYNK